jgi:antitoxin (DNA-binding transcriptional repressor) of toxin-antitoxin stability system
MKILTIRDFRTRPREARAELAEAGEAVLTVNGEPVAVLVAVEDGLEETVELIERVRAQRAVLALRAAARSSGADRLAPTAIGREIAAVRRERSGRRPER